MGYGGFGFATNSHFTLLQPNTFKTNTVPSHMKPSGAICDKGTVKVWQDKNGIHAQRYAFIFDPSGNPIGETPYRSEILVAGANYYSPDIGASVSMNSSCTFAIAYMRDWNYYNLNYMDLYITVTEWGDVSPMKTSTSYINKTWNSYVTGLKSEYLMQFDVASPSVSIIDDGQWVVSAVVPKCWHQCSGSNPPCKVREWSCDNYVMGWRYNLTVPPYSMTSLGDKKNTTNNYMTPYGSVFKIINKIPWFAVDMSGHRDLSAGCYNQGSGYDCPYHQGLAGSNFGWVSYWVEGEGNFGGDKINGVAWNGSSKAYYDDLLFRMTRNNMLDTPITQELPMFTVQGTKRYDHWSGGAGINDSGLVAITGLCKYCNNMQTDPLSEMTDIMGNFVDSNGNKTGSEFVVNDERKGDQYNPSVAINNFDEALYCWKSPNTDCGGYGIYCKMYNARTRTALTNQFRVNSFNSMVVDPEEDQNTDQSNYEWSHPVSVSTNKKGDFQIVYSYPNRIFLNTASKAGIPASYGQGYEVQSSLLVRKR